MINVKINGKPLEVRKRTTIIDAAASARIFIPRLCGHPDLPPVAKCGICIVKVNGKSEVLACATKLRDGMEVETKDREIRAKAYNSLQKHAHKVFRPVSPEIEEVFTYFLDKPMAKGRKSTETNSLVFNYSICVGCSCCYRECNDNQKIGALNEETHTFNKDLCIGCGQCCNKCPTGSLSENSSIPKVLKAFSLGKTMVLQIAPSIRVSIGECFGDPVGTACTGKLVAAAREIGFQYIFDTNFGADLTIIEEGTELIHRYQNNGVFPMFTSCCPAWINFVERFHPELIPNLSSCRSPHMMLGEMIKTYWAEKKNISPDDIYSVSLMPCTAKKDEIERQQHLGIIGAVLTTREFADLIKSFEINWKELESSNFDSLLGESSGAAALFGVTGGVTEAVVRFAHEKLTGEKLGPLKYVQWRGFRTIKQATVKIADKSLKICVCNGIATARKLIESGQYAQFTFIEVMSCPCGCIGGGGQPKIKREVEAKKRATSIYEIDMETKAVTSNDNEEAKTIYSEYLGNPGEGKAHELLHTSYSPYTPSPKE